MDDPETSVPQTRRQFLRTSAAIGVATTGFAAVGGQVAAQGAGLTDRNVTGKTTPEEGVTGNFTKAILTVTDIDEATETVSGTLEYVFNQQGEKTSDTQDFSGVPLSVTDGNNNGRCDILHLEIGPITLELLGLDAFIGGGGRDDPQPIVVDVDAVEGGLLGDLLCSLA